MTKEFIHSFIIGHPVGVMATVAAGDSPEAALMGFAVTPDLELIFDTANTTRKYANLMQNARTAVVIGWDNMTTVQYEGIAEELTGPGCEEWKEIYFKAFPDGRERAKTWPGIVYFKISPKWIRYSSFKESYVVEEMTF
jgi:general stress protein 26